MKTLGTTATNTGAQATAIQKELSAPDRATAQKELQDFNLSTKLLTTLRRDLDKDINDYQTTYAEQLASFNPERGGRAELNESVRELAAGSVRKHHRCDFPAIGAAMHKVADRNAFQF